MRSGASASSLRDSSHGSMAASAPARSMRENCARRVMPDRYGASQCSSPASRAASETSGHPPSAVVPPSASSPRRKATRARHCSNSGVQGRQCSPMERTPAITAAVTASGSAASWGASSSTSAPMRRCRRAATASARSSQTTKAPVMMDAANASSMCSRVSGAQRRMRPRAASPSMSATARNGSRASGSSGGRNAPLPLARRNCPCPRPSATLSG